MVASFWGRDGETDPKASNSASTVLQMVLDGMVGGDSDHSEQRNLHFFKGTVHSMLGNHSLALISFFRTLFICSNHFIVTLYSGRTYDLASVQGASHISSRDSASSMAL